MCRYKVSQVSSYRLNSNVVIKIKRIINKVNNFKSKSIYIFIDIALILFRREATRYRFILPSNSVTIVQAVQGERLLLLLDDEWMDGLSLKISGIIPYGH